MDKSKIIYNEEGKKICVDCGKLVPPERQLYCCKSCCDTVNNRMLNYNRQHDPERRNRHTKQMRARSLKLQNEGICCRCGQREAKQGCVTCAECIEDTHKYI